MQNSSSEQLGTVDNPITVSDEEESEKEMNADRAYVTSDIFRSNVGMEYLDECRMREWSDEGEWVVDVPSRRVLRVSGEEVRGIKHNQVLDLSDEEERWEGDVKDNKPFGWGVLYDRDNHMVYEGFRIDDMNACYGKRYYPFGGVIEYEGGWCEGKRWGKGTHFDQKSHAMFDGEWLNDSFDIEKNAVVTRQNEVKLLLHNRLETLHVGDHACNREVMKNLDLTVLSCLRELRVGNECFKHVEDVKLIGLKKLETVVIGEKCFTKSAWQSNPKSRFLLKNCDRLKELKIGIGSFHDCTLCVIEHLDSMEAMELGKLERDNKMFVYCSLKVKSILADCT